MVKKRNFSLVFHNVASYDSKSSLESYIKTLNPIRYVCGCEAYPDQDGQHIHMFVSFKNGHEFTTMIDKFQKWANDNIVAPKPDGEERAWGRVEVDQMFGSFEQAKDYLKGLTKDKPVDPHVSDYSSPARGTITCDVCAGVFPWYETQYQFNNRIGRCRICATIPHRMLVNYGFNVPEVPWVEW